MTVTFERKATSVELDHVDKAFSGNMVLHQLSLRVEPGEFVSLLGPSGCGKTTALRLIAGLEHVTGGVVRMDDVDVSDIPTNKRDIGMVFQAYSLFPHMTALQNTMFGLEMRNVPSAEARQRAMDSLEIVGLSDLADRYPHAMSGGQQQRIALARALVTSPKVLLLDEPLSALDAQVRTQLRLEVRRIQQSIGITTIFVTHDQEEALAISDRVAVMTDGRIEQIGTPEELYLQPATPIVAAFVGMSSLVRTVAHGGRADVWGIGMPLIGDVPNGDCEVFIRPEHVRMAAEGDPVINATAETSTFLGSMRRTVLRMADGQTLIMQHPAEQRLDVGTSVQITIDPVLVAARLPGAPTQ